MKLDTLIIAITLAIFLSMGIFVVNTYLSDLSALQKQQARDTAVDGCMQNAQYSWQASNHSNPQFTDTTTEPNRYWYKICMQEKGYDIITEL